MHSDAGVSERLPVRFGHGCDSFVERRELSGARSWFWVPGGADGGVGGSAIVGGGNGMLGVVEHHFLGGDFRYQRHLHERIRRPQLTLVTRGTVTVHVQILIEQRALFPVDRQSHGGGGHRLRAERTRRAVQRSVHAPPPGNELSGSAQALRRTAAVVLVILENGLWSGQRHRSGGC